MIREVIPILLKRKWQIIITFLLITTGVVVGTSLMPKEYETRMKILVKSERAETGFGAPGEVSETQVNTEIELLTSNNLIEQVVKATGLQRAEKTGSVPARDREAVAIEKAAKRLQHDLKITPVRKADIIEVKYLAPNAHLAATVLRQFANSYLDAHLKVRSTPGTYDFFSGQAEHYNQELKSIEAELSEFREQDHVILLQQQKEASLQKAVEAKAALLQAQAAVGEYESRIAHTTSQLASLKGRVVTQSREVPNQYLTERLNTMLAELQNKRTMLLTKFRPDDRTVKEVDQEIADTRAALDKATKANGVEQTTDVNPVRQSLEMDLAKEQADLAGFKARLQALSAQEESYRTQLTRLDGATSEFDDLVRHQKEVEDNYLLYSRKAEEARIAESLDKQKISNVTIIETPTEPHLPSKPNVLLNLLVGTFLAGCISLGSALCLEYFERWSKGQPFGISIGEQLEAPIEYPSMAGATYLPNTVHGPSELEELTGLPVLALLDSR